jgi:hypothetical protein
MFWQTKEWREYLLNDGTGYIDRSINVEGESITLLQIGEEFYSPGFTETPTKIYAIEAAAEHYGVKQIQVDTMIKRYLQIPSLTCVVDPFDIHMSKGHKSAVTKANKYLNYSVVKTTEQFMKDYFEVAGKRTRPKRTFELLEEWISKGFGTLLRAEYYGKTAGYTYIIHHENYAYYFMSCVFEQYKQFNVSHFLQSKAFEILREKGIHTYGLGEQCYNSLLHQPSEKEMNISLFKRGFGGEIIYKPRSEYFFDQDYMKQVYEQRIIKYQEAEREHINNFSEA